jgi:DNA end-binding protein Ku
LSRKTGERIRHQKVLEDEGPVDSSDVVKGYEYRKGEYVTIEPDEIEHLRIPSRHTLEVTQFVDLSEIDPESFEKPYFVVPESDVQAEAFAVVRKALQMTKKAGLGKIAFGGREHLVAISAPSDDRLKGMMAYTMRYAEELRDPAKYFGDIKKVAVDEDQLSLAKELIKRKATKFVPEKFKDEYEAALRELVDAKVKHAPIPREEPARKTAKVINLMDALRKSVRGDGAVAANVKASSSRPAASGSRKGITLVKPAAGKAGKSRRSA